MYKIGDTITFQDPFNKAKTYTGVVSVTCTHNMTGVAVYAIEIPGYTSTTGIGSNMHTYIMKIEQHDLDLWQQDIYNTYAWVFDVIGKELYCWISEKDIVNSVQVTIQYQPSIPAEYITISLDVIGKNTGADTEQDEDRGGFRFL